MFNVLALTQSMSFTPSYYFTSEITSDITFYKSTKLHMLVRKKHDCLTNLPD